MVGNVLAASPDLTSLGPYIPTFYQHRERVSQESGNYDGSLPFACVSVFFINFFHRIP